MKAQFKWDHFDDQLYNKYLKAIGKMKTFKILYKYYLGNNPSYPERRKIKTIEAYSREEAIKMFGMWPKLIIKIWEA
jgi:hypothetical protein